MINFIKKLLYKRSDQWVNDQLKEFFSYYLLWAGAVDAFSYSYKEYHCLKTNEGLCGNLHNWCCYKKRFSPKDIKRVCWGLDNLFIKDGLDRLFPFGAKGYFELEWAGVLHTDPKRLAFCKRHSQ